MKKTFTLVVLLFGILSKGLTQTGPQYIRSLLNIVASNGTTTLVDGDLTQYNSSYSDAVDGFDARKMSNPGENLGMIRSGVMLSIERRQIIPVADTIFFESWNLSQTRNYQLEFIAVNLNHPGLVGYLSDSYLNTNTPVGLNDTTLVNFTVNSDPASYDLRRFTLIFTTPVNGTLALTYTALKAYQDNGGVSVNWQTSNENNLRDYIVERSGDGTHFMGLGTVSPNNTPESSYSFSDGSPQNGYDYYRIRSVSLDGQISYSAIMKVYIGSGNSQMKVFPNPISGGVINLQMVNEPADTYQIRVMNNFGQIIIDKQLSYSGGSATQTFSLPPNLSHGMYQMQVTGSGGTTKNITMVY